MATTSGNGPRGPGTSHLIPLYALTVCAETHNERGSSVGGGATDHFQPLAQSAEKPELGRRPRTTLTSSEVLDTLFDPLALVLSYIKWGGHFGVLALLKRNK